MVPSEARAGLSRSASPMDTPPEDTSTSHKERAAAREEARAAWPTRSLEGGRKGARERGREGGRNWSVNTVSKYGQYLLFFPRSQNSHVCPIPPYLTHSLPPSLLRSPLPHLTMPMSTTLSLPTSSENKASNIGLLLSRISPPSLPPSNPASMSSSPVESTPIVGLGKTETAWAWPTEARRP